MSIQKTIVVTGASTGIGQACVLRLAGAGFRVFGGVRKESDGQALKQLASGRVEFVLLDVTNRESIAAAVSAVSAAVGQDGLAGLVNNAGISIGAPLEFLPAADLRNVFEVNVIGQVSTTQAFLPLVEQQHGRIVFISSLAGRVASPITGAYCASKFALEALSDVWRMELAETGVSISVIEPGAVATPIWNKGMEASNAIYDAMPEAGQRRYRQLFEGMKRVAEHGSVQGTVMRAVTDAVMHALTAESPKTRYLIGRGSRLYTLLRFFPDRLRDRLILRALRG
jgi:NAD(P)-dependent dehydrogenase (short-subunit alcohol dehydrogenase family)